MCIVCLVCYLDTAGKKCGATAMSVIGLACYAKYFWDNAGKTPEQVKAISRRRFARTVLHAYDRSPFYHDLYAAHGLRREDLKEVRASDLPAISKEVVREHFAQIATVDPSSPAAIRARTSGSTGKPCEFLYSKRMMTVVQANFARLVNRFGRHPIRLSDFPIRNIHVSSVGPGYASTQLLISGLERWHAQNITLNVALPASEWAERVAGARPNFLSGYPNAIEQLANLQIEGKVCLHPKKIICGGEGITTRQMEKLADVFDADVINYYACTEGMLLGAGGSSYQGIYLFDDIHYFETDDEGHLLITPLYNDAFPLIRYRMDDIVEGFVGNDPSGVLPFTHIDGIAGREISPLFFTNEEGETDYLPALLLDDIDADGLWRYQFVQRDRTHMSMCCVAQAGDTDRLERELRSQLSEILTRKGMRNLSCEIVFVDRLHVNPRSGKVPFTITEEENKNSYGIGMARAAHRRAASCR